MLWNEIIKPFIVGFLAITVIIGLIWLGQKTIVSITGAIFLFAFCFCIVTFFIAIGKLILIYFEDID